MTAMIRSLHLQGIECLDVEIEVDVAQGLPQFIIVGLPDAAVSEARDRVRSAIKNAGFSFPRQRVTVNLAPAHIRKVGPLYDLPIALGILIASGELRANPEQIFVGELALDGRVHSIRGALPLACYAAQQHRDVIVPSANAAELSVIPDERIFLAETLRSVVDHLTRTSLLPTTAHLDPSTESDSLQAVHTDFNQIAGQYVAKRACEIAAAGRHNLLFVGPPGVGKTMLARALPSILPALSPNELLQSTMLYSVAGARAPLPLGTPPFRSPHHTTSPAAILGGGQTLQPGELSLAHGGVLFLDELPEFRRDVLEGLRQPLEEGTVSVSRVSGSVRYPARSLFVAAHNPCPCGFLGVDSPNRSHHCRCSYMEVERYARRLSGPLLDRIDLKVRISFVESHDIEQQLSNPTQPHGESSTQIAERVSAARQRQYARQSLLNGDLDSKSVMNIIQLEPDARSICKKAMKNHGLSMRGYIKTLKVARTIADLQASRSVTVGHINEALNYTASLSDARRRGA